MALGSQGSVALAVQRALLPADSEAEVQNSQQAQAKPAASGVFEGGKAPHATEKVLEATAAIPQHQEASNLNGAGTLAEALRTSHNREGSLQQKVSGLQERLQEATTAKHTALRELTLQRRRAMKPQSKPHQAVAIPQAEPGDDVFTMSSKIAKLCQEVADQDRLLSGYQAENEAATRRIRTLQAAAAACEASLRAENARLQQQLNSLQDSHSMGKSAQQLAARLELEQQLQAAVQEAADNKQSLLEAKQQLTALQNSNCAINCRADEMDAHGDQERQLVLARVHQQMNLMRRDHAADIHEWTQRLTHLTETSAATIHDQQSTISRLQDELQQRRQRSTEQTTGNQATSDQLNRHSADSGQNGDLDRAAMTDLQAKLQILQAALLSRQQDSPTCYSGPSASVHLPKQSSANRRTNARLEVQLRPSKLMQANENDSVGGNKAALASSAAAGQVQGNARRTHAAQEERDHVRLQKERIRQLEADLGAKDRRIKELEQPSTGPQRRKTSLDPRQHAFVPMASPAETPGHLNVQSCQAQTIPEAVQDSQQHSNQGNGGDAIQSRHEVNTLRQQVRELQDRQMGLQQKLAAREGALSGLQATHSETLERLASAQVEAESAQLADMTKKLAAKQAEWSTWDTQLREQVKELQQQLLDARALQPWTPKAHEYHLLESKIQELEAAESAREARWRMLGGLSLDDVWRDDSSTHPGTTQLRERIVHLETQLAQRSQELLLYREELDSLSSFMCNLQSQPC
ncbi:hypothetical protein WJX74_008353 [Apatococcus lobatus]|uniref:Centrosomal protein of 162 kDa n=1 Tax=Apatococcus lobatus TaxID=904363 RepID=A0AAW1RW36_9CHLO